MDTIHSKMLLGFSIAICSLCYVVIVYFIVNIAIDKSGDEMLKNTQLVHSLQNSVNEMQKDRIWRWNQSYHQLDQASSNASKEHGLILEAIREHCQ